MAFDWSLVVGHSVDVSYPSQMAQHPNYLNVIDLCHHQNVIIWNKTIPSDPETLAKVTEVTAVKNLFSQVPKGTGRSLDPALECVIHLAVGR